MVRWNIFGQREAQTASEKQTLLDKLTWIKPQGRDGIQLSVLKELRYGIAELPIHQPPPPWNKGD